MLEKEIKKHKDDFVKRHFRHMRMVQDNMLLLENNLDKLPFKVREFALIERCLKHDLDKFSKPLVNHYYRIFEAMNYGRLEKMTDEEKNDLFFCRKAHYTRQRHHCEYHENTKKNFSNVDLCEMCCDLLAISEEVSEDYSKECFEYCQKKLFAEHKIILIHKNSIFRIFELLINLKKGYGISRRKK